jgi:hypothetical protein
MAEHLEFKTALALLLGDYANGEYTSHPACDEHDDGTRRRYREYEDSERAKRALLTKLVTRYIAHRAPPRPLCLAVFGPPGSGKSFAVKEIVKQAAGEITQYPEFAKLKLPVTTLNLTQLVESGELALAVTRIAGEQTEESVPVIFFDEFDTARDGAPYGWLPWFLAPMHDGEILHLGALVRLRRAIYVFAGGTAETMKQFAGRVQSENFRLAKGPDFISRLRAYLDVEGPNEGTPDRAAAQPHSGGDASRDWLLRRAQILKHELSERSRRLKVGSKITPERDFLATMLKVGRFRHGARSIGAIVEVSDVSADGRLGLNQLPEPAIVAMHADRGPLDPTAIGGHIVMSGFPHDDEKESVLREIWKGVAGGLWRAGAQIAYGGRWEVPGSESLVQSLQSAFDDLPKDLRRKDAGSDAVVPRLLCFGTKDGGKDERMHEGVLELKAGPRPVVAGDIHFGQDVPQEERDWLANAVRAFNRRVFLAEGSAARFVVGGSSKVYPDRPQRFPGVVEEVMLSLALQTPVYIVGAMGGAARDVGLLLGLERPWMGRDLPTFRVGDDTKQRLGHLDKIEEWFRPPPWKKLPVTLDEVIHFLTDHAIGGKLWPDNGLSVEENRTLFSSADAGVIVDSIKKGLLALDAKGH